jgi:tetratricopeptide (TPR) repeat protein
MSPPQPSHLSARCKSVLYEERLMDGRRFKLLRARGALMALLGACALPAFGQEVCGSLENAFGPFDYRVASPGDLKVVETHHFTQQVETLRGGQEGYIGSDIDYTLRAFPNHPRALLAIMKLAAREGRDPPQHSRYSVTCWFMRAERFRPDDAMVKVLYGTFLAQQGKKSDALAKLDEAAKQEELSANAAYNMGLVYADLGRYDDALKAAWQAYGQGFPLGGLRDKLQRAGKWRNPPPPAEQSAPTASAASAPVAP